MKRRCLTCLLFVPAFLAADAPSGRMIVSLDGEWRIDESLQPDRMPASFSHTVHVPGLINQAQPAFPQVDEFETRELIDKRVRLKELPASARTEEVGISKQPRNYFWYSRTFRPPAKKQVAILKINKAQFGVQVWLNGRKIGDHFHCFAAGFFDVTSAIRWDAENMLVIRVGAHPGVLPKDIPAGTDFEKLKWTPGIYDSVSLHLSDNPVIETVQVAPRLTEGAVVVQASIRNYGAAGTWSLTHQIKEWKSGTAVATGDSQQVSLAPGEARTVTQTIALPNAHLWSPEDPFLYVVDSTTGGDRLASRFGMREFRFDTTTKRAYLNGRVYFLRGSNITLHRFFEDPKIGSLPWQEAWVRKLLVDIPKKMHWNAFRFCIGPVPDRWMDIADEAGLLIQNEFFIWTGGETWNNWHKEWSASSLTNQYSLWMRDNWNHPSQAVWDASNETQADLIAKEVIPVVRKLDLSNRPWENGYAIPVGPDDPVEDHPYLFSRNYESPNPGFDMVELERMTGPKSANSGHPTGHSTILNEYGWLWLNRDGSPVELTKRVYAKLLGEGATNEQRIELNNYLLGGLTEFWRAHRNFAGVLHFVYLTCSYPGVYTSDHFRDIEKLELHPAFENYVREAFRPTGVYINFWQPKVQAAAKRRIAVMVVNDDYGAVEGKLSIGFGKQGSAGAVADIADASVPPLGQQSYRFDLQFPDQPGDYVLRAVLQPSKAGAEPTVSVRKVRVD